MSTHNVQALIGLSGFTTQSGGFRLTRERSVRLDLPERFTADHLRRMHRDLEILADMASNRPDDIIRMHNAVLSFDFNQANSIAADIGLDEHRITNDGGGLNVVIIGIAIAAALLLSSDSGPSSQGGSDAGPGDAGPAGTRPGDAGAGGQPQ